MNSSGSELYREVQYFRQPWLWLINAGVALIIWYGFIRQVILGVPFGNNPASNSLMIVLWLLVGIGFPLFFYLLRLTTVVKQAGIYCRFFPFHFSYCVIPYADILSYEIRTYNPILEYGGWGIRYGRSGKAYNVSGNKGMQLVLAGGKKLLIGTQQPEAFLKVLDEVFNHKKE